MSAAEIIDGFFRNLRAYPHVPYVPIGKTIVDEVNRMGPNGLYLSTACALIQQESTGRNIMGCDHGSQWTNVPPYCNIAVTKERVEALIRNYYTPPVGGANGIGFCQLTSIGYVEEAQRLGGAHLPGPNMRVGFRVLNGHIRSLGWPAGAAAFNAGASNWRSVINTYGASVARLEREWATRLRGGDSEVADQAVVLKKGLGKDGNPNGSYERAHPTLYTWRADVNKRVHSLVNMPEFRGKVWANTYKNHPPDWNRDTTSVDFWGWGGRGSRLPDDLHEGVFRELFNDPNKPDIWWLISRGKMWTRAGGWQAAPWGPVGSDAGHWNHLHITYTD